MRVLTIVVPFPPGGKWLSTNSNRHLHPHAQAKRVQPWRTSAAALAEGKTPFAGPVAVVATIHKARRNRWDIDGITPTVKACVDGLRDAGVLTEDDDQHITRLTLQVGAVDPRAPRLVLSVHEADQIEEDVDMSYRCTSYCWTPVECVVCGRPFSPIGRSVALEAVGGYCDPHEPCDPSQVGTRQQHLWDEHDAARVYADPDGWAAHVAKCETCAEREGVS